LHPVFTSLDLVTVIALQIKVVTLESTFNLEDHVSVFISPPTAGRSSNNPRHRVPYSTPSVTFSLFPVAPTLEHRASVKRFVSLQFLNPNTVGRIPWMGDRPVARPLPTQDKNTQ
jgi:hypothetical protein